jgi:hypothetical protein
MSNAYHVALRPIGDHPLPPLLKELGAFVATKRHGSLGWFDALATEEIPRTWDEANAERLARAGFVFLALPEGSLLALFDTGAKKTPPAVVLFGSEGELRTVADGLEEFLHLWADGATGITELDDEEAAAGRAELAAWLRERKVKAKKAKKPFDVQAWLDGDAAPTPTPVAPERVLPKELEALPAHFRSLIDLHGRRADDPKVVQFVAELGGKLPTSATDMGSAAEVKAKKLGFTLWFAHDERNDNFPLVRKSKSSYLPYLSQISFDSTYGPLPFGLEWKHTEEQVAERLGPPIKKPLFPDQPDGPQRTFWYRTLIPGWSELRFQYGKKGLAMTLWIPQAAELTSRHGVPGAPLVGVFVAWAILRGLLDEARFPQHAALLERVRARTALGTEFVREALPRGLWDVHLKDLPELRLHAGRWLRNMGGLSATKDFIALFGSRKNQHAHDEPALDDATWEAVERATPMLDEQFARWVQNR